MVDVDGIRAGLMFFGVFYGGLLLEYAVYRLYKWLRREVFQIVRVGRYGRVKYH